MTTRSNKKLIKKYDKLAGAYLDLNKYLNMFDTVIEKENRIELLKEIKIISNSLDKMKEVIKNEVKDS